jgi:hypothetical protein
MKFFSLSPFAFRLCLALSLATALTAGAPKTYAADHDLGFDRGPSDEASSVWPAAIFGYPTLTWEFFDQIKAVEGRPLVVAVGQSAAKCDQIAEWCRANDHTFCIGLAGWTEGIFQREIRAGKIRRPLETRTIARRDSATPTRLVSARSAESLQPSAFSLQPFAQSSWPAEVRRYEASEFYLPTPAKPISYQSPSASFAPPVYAFGGGGGACLSCAGGVCYGGNCSGGNCAAGNCSAGCAGGQCFGGNCAGGFCASGRCGF